MVKQWLCFKLEPNEDGKFLKVPYYADGSKRYGKQGTEDDMERLVQLEDAISRVKRGKADGVGFAFISGGPSAVDFDGPESVATNAKILSRTWSEVSVGGLGAHAFVMGDIQTNNKPKGSGVEFFSSKGFVAVTGEPLAGCEGVKIHGKRILKPLIERTINGHAHAGVTGGTDDIRNIPTPYSQIEREKIAKSLKTFRCSKASYSEWLTVGQALHSADPDVNGPTFRAWLAWSQRDETRFVDEEDLTHRWEGFKGTRGITLATLYGYARDVRARRTASQKNDDARDDTKGISLKDLEGIDYGTARIFIEGLIAEGLTLLTGQKKLARKTFWILQCAAQASVGDPFMGRNPSQPLRVLCYMLEEGGTVFDADGKEVAPLDVVLERLKSMMLLGTATRGGVRFKTTLPSMEEGGIEQIEEDAARNDIIFIDSRQMILNEDADRERNVWRKDYKHLLPLREIARKHHCAIVVVNHASKGSDDRDAIDAGASTGGIDAAVDGMIVIQRPNKDENFRIKMTLHHRRLVSKELEIRWDEKTCLFQCIGPWLGSGRVADIMSVVVERTRKKSSEPLTTLQIARYVFGPNADKQRANVSRILTGLRRDGMVVTASNELDGNSKARLWRASDEAITRHADEY